MNRSQLGTPTDLVCSALGGVAVAVREPLFHHSQFIGPVTIHRSRWLSLPKEIRNIFDAVGETADLPGERSIRDQRLRIQPLQGYGRLVHQDGLNGRAAV